MAKSSLVTDSMLMTQFALADRAGRGAAVAGPHAAEDGPPRRLGWPMVPFILIFLFMVLFDTLGTLIGVCQQAGLIRDNRLERARQALVSDAVGTVAGAALGTSTVTSFVESAAGVEHGGRTGLTALCVAALFLLALFFSPLIAMVGSYPPITAPALVIVGSMMMRNVTKVDWANYAEAMPAFLIMIGIPLAYSIADGLAVGFIAYPIIKLCCRPGPRREVADVPDGGGAPGLLPFRAGGRVTFRGTSRHTPCDDILTAHGVSAYWGPLQRRGKAGKIEPMLIPQYSLRWLLGATTVCADGLLGFCHGAAGQPAGGRGVDGHCGPGGDRAGPRPFVPAGLAVSLAFSPPSPSQPRRPSKRSWWPWSWPSYRPQGRTHRDAQAARTVATAGERPQPGPAGRHAADRQRPADGHRFRVDRDEARLSAGPHYGPSHRPGHGGQDALDRDPAGPAADGGL